MSRILIVDDEATIASMYQFKLEMCGYKVLCAHNGTDGLEKAKSFSPDLILLDIRMPIMSGDKMLAALRAQDWGSHIRVIVLTNISRDEAPSNLRLLNVDRYVVKAHTTPSQIVSIVRDLIDPLPTAKNLN